MHTASLIAALATGALAVPYMRDLVTKVDVVYATDIVTVTAGQATPSAPVSTIIGQVSQALPTSQPPAPPISTIEAQHSLQAPAPSSSPPSAAPSSYQDIVVFHHNIHRRNHSVDDLEWDEGLAASAATIAASCLFVHNLEVDGGGYGQNIAAGVEANNISAVITDVFYNGEEPYYAGNYGQANPDMSLSEKWGHFTQVVWKTTTRVGCATQYCPGGVGNVGSGVSPYFTVCNYKNPGNGLGEYGVNVLEPQGQPTANWNTGLSSY